MRLTEEQMEAIRQCAHQIGGELARVRVFGSRLDDSARGGDLDLMNNPAQSPRSCHASCLAVK